MYNVVGLHAFRAVTKSEDWCRDRCKRSFQEIVGYNTEGDARQTVHLTDTISLNEKFGLENKKLNTQQ